MAGANGKEKQSKQTPLPNSSDLSCPSFCMALMVLPAQKQSHCGPIPLLPIPNQSHLAISIFSFSPLKRWFRHCSFLYLNKWLSIVFILPFGKILFPFLVQAPLKNLTFFNDYFSFWKPLLELKYSYHCVLGCVCGRVWKRGREREIEPRALC